MSFVGVTLLGEFVPPVATPLAMPALPNQIATACVPTSWTAEDFSKTNIPLPFVYNFLRLIKKKFKSCLWINWICAWTISGIYSGTISGNVHSSLYPFQVYTELHIWSITANDELKRTNREIRNLRTNPDLVTIIKSRKLRWLGHILRREEESVVRKRGQGNQMEEDHLAAIRDELVQELSRVEGYIEKLLTKEDGGNLFKRHSTFLDVWHRIINQLTIRITFVVMWFETMTTLNICNLHRLLSKLFHFISRSCWELFNSFCLSSAFPVRRRNVYRRSLWIKIWTQISNSIRMILEKSSKINFAPK